jgi:carboxylate-amine ligase
MELLTTDEPRRRNQGRTPCIGKDDMSVRQSEQGPAAYKAEEMIFRPSPTTTVGAELELMLLDPDSGDLAPGAIRLLKACAEEKIDGVSAELMQSMIELKTGVCQNVTDVREQLVPRLRRVRNIARSMGYQLAMSGTHPFHRPSTSAVTPSERYDRLVDRLAYLIHQRVVFGLHIHVGLPDGDMALGVMNQLVRYLPHMLALSASSPFWQGIDTGLASCRTALYRTLPHAGVPRYFPRWKNFRSYFRVMRECGAIQSMKDIYWDIRPRPEFGTIELRVCDMPATLETTFALVAFVRSLAIASQRLLEKRPQLQKGDIRRHWIAVENKWLATRYGLEAIYIRTPAGKRRPLRQDLQELLNRLMPIAAETGDDVFLSTLLPLDKFEPDADRQRRLYRESGKAHRARPALPARPTAPRTEPLWPTARRRIRWNDCRASARPTPTRPTATGLSQTSRTSTVRVSNRVLANESPSISPPRRLARRPLRRRVESTAPQWSICRGAFCSGRPRCSSAARRWN